RLNGAGHLMDISLQSEIVLRDAEYKTWTCTGSTAAPVICFENVASLGFLLVFPTVSELIGSWEAVQKSALARHAASLRASGPKAWNVYSVFLTPESLPSRARIIERLEEDFSLTRKIARAGIQTADDLERALLPLISIRSRPLLGAANFEARLRARLKDIPLDAVTALMNDMRRQASRSRGYSGQTHDHRVCRALWLSRLSRQSPCRFWSRLYRSLGTEWRRKEHALRRSRVRNHRRD